MLGYRVYNPVTSNTTVKTRIEKKAHSFHLMRPNVQQADDDGIEEQERVGAKYMSGENCFKE